MSEQVVLLDEDGRAVGVADKSTVHHRSTPLHLAFSLYLFASGGGEPRLLVTRRALHKPTWPGVWTNSCCGHPAPGEPFTDAVRRRTRQELGVEVDELRLALPGFRYRAEMADGVVENELCPVLVGTADPAAVSPDPAEVSDLAWVAWPALRTGVLDGSREVSPWCAEQVRALPPDPLGQAPADPRLLPAAALDPPPPPAG